MARAKLEFRSKNGAIPRRPGLDRVIEIVPRRFLRHSFLLLSPPRFDLLASRLESCRGGQPSGLGDGYIAVGCLPADVKFGGVGRGVLERQAHHFLRRSHGLGLHRDAAEVFGLVVREAPLAGLIVDDELPDVGAGQRINGVRSGRDQQVAELQRHRGNEGSGGIRAGAPDLAIRDELAHDLASAHVRRVVGDVDGAAGDGNAGGCGLTRQGRSRLRIEGSAGNDQQCGGKNGA